MATGWFYQKNGTVNGPIASGDLKTLAASGWLLPGDLISTDQVTWKPAGSYKGLFGSPTSPPPVPNVESDERTDSSSVLGNIFSHPLLIFGSIVCCFPIGLLLIWFSSWKTSRKLWWTGGFCLVAILFTIARSYQVKEATEHLVAGNKFWSEGDQDKAVEEYRLVLKAPSIIPDQERAIIFKRVIQQDLSEGKKDSAARLIEKAKSYKVELPLDDSGEKPKEPTVASDTRPDDPVVTSKPNPKGDDEEIVPWPAGFTKGKFGDRVGPRFSKEELKEVAGKFIQNEIKPGWKIDRVLAIMGKPTKFSRMDSFGNASEAERRKVLDDPLTPPDLKKHMLKVIEICTWEYKEDPGKNFIMLSFMDGEFTDVHFALP